MRSILTAAVILVSPLSCVGPGGGNFAKIKTAGNSKVLQGITFAVERGEIYVPLDEVEGRLTGRLVPQEKQKSLRKLVDGTLLVSLKDLTKAGVVVLRTEDGADLRFRMRGASIEVGSKKAEVNLGEQRLHAWQGGRLILKSRVSSGRRGRTPTGDFNAGPYKARSHYSSLYDNAPMPWSVQVTGHVFIHGFTSVPNYPASHGCIRVPLNEGNPAKFFYEWVDVGTPISVHR